MSWASAPTAPSPRPALARPIVVVRRTSSMQTCATGMTAHRTGPVSASSPPRASLPFSPYPRRVRNGGVVVRGVPHGSQEPIGRHPGWDRAGRAHGCRGLRVPARGLEARRSPGPAGVSCGPRTPIRPPCRSWMPHRRCERRTPRRQPVRAADWAPSLLRRSPSTAAELRRAPGTDSIVIVKPASSSPPL